MSTQPRIIVSTRGDYYSESTSVKLIDLQTMQNIAEYHTGLVTIEFTPEGDMFFIEDTSKTIFYDAITGSEITTIINLGDGQISFAQDRLLISKQDGTVEIWGVKQN